MNLATVSSKSSDLANSESSLIVKFRRLKIEENVLSKINRTAAASTNTTEESFMVENYCDENKRTSSSDKLKSYFIEIRDLFEDVKVNTILPENIEALDINDVKRTILNLENKICNFETSLKHQLQCLKLEEADLTRQMDEESPNNEKRRKRSNKLEIKAFSDIVPSPVKNLIHSPFKSQEVQDFQEFMANSKSKYGGWIPYNHDIFVKSWQKYFITQKNIEDFEYQDVYVKNSEIFELFIRDVSDKIAGMKLEDLLAHHKWYTKYIYLKERQKKALEKWRLKKQLTKSSDMCKNMSATKDINIVDNVKKNKNGLREIARNSPYDREDLEFQISVTNNIVKGNGDSSHNLSKYKSTLTYTNPTKQWNHRCKVTDEYKNHAVGNIENNTQKRRIPEWRLIFQTT